MSEENGFSFPPPLPAGNRQLSLKMRNANGTKLVSDTNVILVVPERVEGATGPRQEPKISPSQLRCL